jgi:hypothetical protein
MPFGFLAPKDILNYLAFHSFLEDVISATRRLDNIRNLGKGTAPYLPFCVSQLQSGFNIK